MSDTSTLRRIAKWYQNLPHQNEALDYIESKLSSAELEQALNLYSPKKIKYDSENLSDLPIEVNLPVPYLSQLDNRYRPSGTCNVTSVAMCLMYFNIKPETKEPQLEDELFFAYGAKGARSPLSLAFSESIPIIRSERSLYHCCNLGRCKNSLGE